MQDVLPSIKLPQAKITLRALVNCLTEKKLIDFDPEKLGRDSTPKGIINQITKPLKIFFHSKDVEPFLNKSYENPQFIYIARKGQKFDGHTLAEKILKCGHIFMGEIESIQNIYPTKVQEILQHPLFILVKNTEESLNCTLESAFKLNKKEFLTIAVTGTNGKTSVTQLTGDLLSKLYQEDILKIGTLGVQFGAQILPVSHVTTPDYPSFLSILSLAQQNKLNKIVLEATSHGLKEKRLGQWPIDIAIFTNLTQDHLDYHKTMADYRAAKQQLFSTYLSPTGTAVININNEEWKEFIVAAQGEKRTLIVVGDKSLHKKIQENFAKKFASIAYIHIENPISNLQEIRGTMVLKKQLLGHEEHHDFFCPLLGEFQFENILCTAGAGLALHFSLEKICKAFGFSKNIPGRLEIIKSNSGCIRKSNFNL
jgi:UDP-N-acetylmuramoyl-L-alanyl-D-glutamate--2,6-diaminopimelate ligase